jgi:hypothetical protein
VVSLGHCRSNKLGWTQFAGRRSDPGQPPLLLCEQRRHGTLSVLAALSSVTVDGWDEGSGTGMAGWCWGMGETTQPIRNVRGLISLQAESVHTYTRASRSRNYHGGVAYQVSLHFVYMCSRKAEQVLARK